MVALAVSLHEPFFGRRGDPAQHAMGRSAGVLHQELGPRRTVRLRGALSYYTIMVRVAPDLVKWAFADPRQQPVPVNLESNRRSR